MANRFAICADAHVKTFAHAFHASTQFEHNRERSSSPTVLACALEKAFYLAALSDVRTILKNLSELRATRVNKPIVNFLSKHHAFAPLLARLTKNYWLTLTHAEKTDRDYLRKQRLILKREQELLDSISVRKRLAEKFFKAHQLNKPIRLSDVELTWLDRHAQCRAIVSIKSKFLLPTSRQPFDFSEAAFTQLAAKLRFEMLTPSDINLLKAHGVPFLPNNTLSLDDAAWAREPYTKAVLYRLVKYRRDEQAVQVSLTKNALASGKQSFKRIHLSEEETWTKLVTTHSNQWQEIEPAVPARIVHVHDTPSFRRVELEHGNTSPELIARNKISERRWVEEIKEKVLSLFRIPKKTRALAE